MNSLNYLVLRLYEYRTKVCAKLKVYCKNKETI